MKERSNPGFTLVELLVVIAIIGVFVAMTIPAVQASRETGRRSLCQANLAQLTLALAHYENAYECFPPGVVNPDGPIRSEAIGYHHGWLVTLLPYLDEGNAYRAIDFSAGVYDSNNATVRRHSPNVFICPSEPSDEPATTSYAACHHDVEAPIAEDNHGLLFLNSHTRRQEITDGASYTLLAGEKRVHVGDLGWMSGTRASLRNTGLSLNNSQDETAAGGSNPAANVAYVGGFSSAHPSGVMVALADGSVRFLATTTNAALLQRLAHRADGNIVEIDLRD